jgi:hypothetical protein
MTLQSDIQLNVSKFLPSAVELQTATFNEHLMDNTASGPKWYEVSEEITQTPRVSPGLNILTRCPSGRSA